jgi:Ca2+-binding RTX toxin-like protein
MANLTIFSATSMDMRDFFPATRQSTVLGTVFSQFNIYRLSLSSGYDVFYFGTNFSYDPGSPPVPAGGTVTYIEFRANLPSNTLLARLDGFSAPFADLNAAALTFASILGPDETFNDTAGNDTLLGGDGNDTLNLTTGVDHADGGAGTDIVTRSTAITDAVSINLNLPGVQGGGAWGSLSGIEQLGDRSSSVAFRTGAGADIIVTTTGTPGEGTDDYIITGDNNDDVSISRGHDFVELGTGSGDTDILRIDYGHNSAAVIGSSVDQGNGDWQIDYGDSEAGALNDRIQASGVERVFLTTGSGNDDIAATDGQDNIATGAGDDIINKRGGQDEVDGGSGTDRLSGTYSTTLDISYDARTDVAVFNVWGSIADIEQLGDRSQSQIFATGSGNDVLVTGYVQEFAGLDDYVNTGAGNDTVTVGRGHDLIELGTDATDFDELIVEFSHNTAPVAGLSIDQGNGDWQLDYGDNEAGALYDRIQASGVERVRVSTGSGNDTITTTDGQDIISLGDGDDFIDKRGGQDEVHGGAGTDTLVGTYATAIDLQHDVNTDGIVYYTWGSIADVEQLGDRSASQSFSTGSGNDTLITGTTAPFAGLDDYINTGLGNDTVTVGRGIDSVDLGTGLADNDHLIVDFQHNTANVVGSTISGVNGDWNVDYADNEAGASYDRVLASGVERLTLMTGSGNDTVTTTDGTDIVATGLGDDIIDGRGGLDQIDGGGGTDTLIRTIIGSHAVQYDVNVDTAFSGFWGSIADVEQLGDRSASQLFSTASGNDTLITGTTAPFAGLDDFISTGDGNDTVTVGRGHDSVDLGAGAGDDDHLIVDFQHNIADVSGNSVDQGNGDWQLDYSDTESGASYDRIQASGVERLTLTTGSGNDTVTTTDGTDIVATGLGNDSINSRSGLDQINGGGGTDTLIRTITGPDAVQYNTNVDGVFSGTWGSIADVEQLGDRSNSQLFSTGSGNDTLNTESSIDGLDDFIDTGAGSDLASVARGHDVVSMGAATGDDDHLVIDYSHNSTNITGNAINQGSGDWAVDYADGEAGLLYDRIQGSFVERVTLSTGSGDDSVTTTGGNDVVLAGAGTDTVNAGDGDDTIDLGSGAGTVDGGGGSDLLLVDHSALATAVTLAGTPDGTVQAAGNAVTYTSIERFQVKGGSASDTLTGAALFDVLEGNNGDDTLNGLGGSDQLRGGEGNDVLDGGADADTMDGGAGNDLFYVDDAGDGVTELANDGTDTVSTSLASYALAAHVEILVGSNAAGQTLLGNALGNTMFGAGGSDGLYGEDGVDVIYGGGGSDVMAGGLLGDYLDGEAGVDVIFGNEGGDSVIGGADGDYLDGGAGVDVVLGGDGGDTVIGGADTDYLFGEAGVDVLLGGLGVDVLYGGADLDYMFGEEDGDFLAGGDGADSLYGGDGDDSLFGEGDGDFLTGEAGNDVLYGGAGGDSLLGAAGNDFLLGEAGSDVLDGGTGSDYLTGGSGADYFQFAAAGFANGDVDRVTDFSRTTPDADLILISTTYQAGHAVTQAGADVSIVLQLGGGQTATILVQNTALADVTAGLLFV